MKLGEKVALFRRRNNPHWNVIRLYCVDSAVNRETYVLELISMLQESFKKPLLNFSIHGIKGTPKGRSDSVKTFERRIKEIGLQDAYAVEGEVPDCFGFSASFGVKAGGSDEFCILVIWSSITEYPDGIPIARIKALSRFFPFVYGYDQLFPKDTFVTTESRIKKSFFGESVLINPKLIEWQGRLQGIFSGEIRSLYFSNYLNAKQVENLKDIDLPPVEKLTESMFHLRFSTAEEYELFVLGRR